MTVTDELLRNSEAYSRDFAKGHLAMPPALNVAIVACMDARINPYGIFGLEEGDAHVIRNAGGAITGDVIRSLVISQRLLGTTEIILVHHFDCGMLTFKGDDFLGAVEEETGIRPPWATEAFVDPVLDVHQSLARIKASPFLIHTDKVRGFVYDDKDGRLTEVKP